ncbi:thioredoxin [Mycoplasmoides genitalium]|uniref:thioredoxin n=1 Tax=Mycoplasmoides genitalium TaxID=2097 RepID=UPI002FCE3915
MVTEIRSLKQLEEIFSAKKNVIVDFWAAWCGPCKLTSPEFQKAADEFSDAQFVKVNVDDHTDIAAAYKITSLPTIVVFENGIEKKRAIGFMPKTKIIDLFNN